MSMREEKVKALEELLFETERYSLILVDWYSLFNKSGLVSDLYNFQEEIKNKISKLEGFKK